MQTLPERLGSGTLDRDERTFQHAIATNIHRLRRIAGRILGNPEDADDAVQEALLRAHRALPRFRGESTLFTWLYRITISSASNLSRQRRRRGTLEVPLDIDELTTSIAVASLNIATPEHELATRRLQAAVRDAFANLPDDQRIALELREIDELSYEEIAKITRAPVNTVRSRIFRARERIAARIEPHIEGGFRR